MQDTTRPRWLKWTTYHLIVYVVMSDFNVSLAASRDYGRLMKPSFNDTQILDQYGPTFTKGGQ